MRRRTIATLLALFAGGVVPGAQAEEVKLSKIIVPYGAGAASTPSRGLSPP